MQRWGSELYGNPCHDCGFGWDLTPGEAVASVREIPRVYAHRLVGARGAAAHPELAWTVAGYVSHVTDNLRTWAERLAGGYLAGDIEVPDYDQDLLSVARHYNEISLAGSIWSLQWAVTAWLQAVETALAAEVVLHHAERGTQTTGDVARNNAHDAHHHLWDIQRILSAQ